MSKADEIRALKEAKFKRQRQLSKAARQVKPIANLPAKLPVAALQAMVEETKVKVRLSSHPDCAECARRREQTRLRVKKARAKK